jgi:hypothetical protein
MTSSPFLVLNCSSIHDSAVSILQSRHPGLLSVKLQGTGGLQLAGPSVEIFAALSTIALEDLALVDGVMDTSGAELSPKKVNIALREPKVERSRKLIKEEMLKCKNAPCPIDRFGYAPFPQNTKKTTLEQQRTDAVLVSKCTDFMFQENTICKACHTATLQRALKELRGE